ncbi:MAG: ROK family protein [Bacteroidales bacterium]
MTMRYAIGIDLGGTAIKYAVINQEGQFFFSGKLPSRAQESADAILSQLKSAISLCLDYCRQNEIQPVGIGLGTPGIIDATNRIVMGGAENLVGWENLDIATPLEELSGLPVFVSNDANLMGLGEGAFGAGLGSENIVFITVGTGIGGAVMINGKLFNGFANRGTELGHTPLFSDGKACACGSTGCLEAYASVTALVEDFTKAARAAGCNYDEKDINGKFIIDLYHQKDPIALESLNNHFYYLGRGLAGFINIFSPQQIIVGGGISEAGAFYIEQVRDQALKHAMTDCSVNTEIKAATLGNNAGCMGAAQLVFSMK